MNVTMPEPDLNDLGVTAEDVDQVEDAVLAEAQAAAAVAADDDFEQTIASVDAQIAALRKEERGLQMQHKDRRQPAGLSALRKRLDHALTRRQGLFEAHLERERLVAGERALKPADIPDDKPSSGESHREFLIRTGKLTPFQGQHGYERDNAQSQPVRRRLSVNNVSSLPCEEASYVSKGVDTKFLEPAMAVLENEEVISSRIPLGEEDSNLPAKNARKCQKLTVGHQARQRDAQSPDDEGISDMDDDGDEDFVPNDFSSQKNIESKKRNRTATRKSRSFTRAIALKGSDGLESNGTDLEANEGGLEQLEPQSESLEGDDFLVEEQEEVEFEGGLLMPASIYDRLFAYQRTGVSCFVLYSI